MSNAPFPASRRQFLKTSVAASSISALGMAARAQVAGSDILRLGMIGCGGRATGAAVNAMNVDPGVKLVAMCDVFMDRVKAKREHLQAQKPGRVDVPDDRCFDGFDGYKHVIEASDVVVIANAAKFHPLHIMTALEAGKHVFVEKPHGIDPAGIRTLREAIALADQKKLCLVSGLQSRFYNLYTETMKRVHDGAIGDIVAMEENFLRGPYGLYAREPGQSEVLYQTGNQYHFTWLSGDDVPQSLVHNMDRALWARGDIAPVKCHGMGGRSSNFDPIYGDVFDHHAVVYEFEDGVKCYAFARTINGCHNDSNSYIQGTKGRCILTRGVILGENEWRFSGKKENPYDEEHRALFKAIREGGHINSGEHMARSTLTTIMGQVSCYTGKEVTWEQINASNFHYPPLPEACHVDMDPPTRPGPDGTYPTFVPGTSALL